MLFVAGCPDVLGFVDGDRRHNLVEPSPGSLLGTASDFLSRVNANPCGVS
jgi:hypothetical protein